MLQMAVCQQVFEAHLRRVYDVAGIAGSTTAGVGNAGATNGTTVAEIYDPSKPIGQRWSPVGDSKIWRLYHSIAFLTPNAEVSCSPFLAKD